MTILELVERLQANAVMQDDSNLVIYNPDGKAIWASNTNGKDGIQLIMQSDCDAVLYTPSGHPVWASNTNR